MLIAIQLPDFSSLYGLVCCLWLIWSISSCVLHRLHFGVTGRIVALKRGPWLNSVSKAVFDALHGVDTKILHNETTRTCFKPRSSEYDWFMRSKALMSSFQSTLLQNSPTEPGKMFSFWLLRLQTSTQVTRDQMTDTHTQTLLGFLSESGLVILYQASLLLRDPSLYFHNCLICAWTHHWYKQLLFSS